VIIILPLILSQISVEIRRQRRTRKGEVLKIHPGELMAHWTFEVKFLFGTQFLFRILMFATGEDETLELLTRGPAPNHHQPIYGEARYYPTNPSTTSTLGGGCSGLNPYAGSYAPISMTSWGHPIEAPGVQSEHRALLRRAHLPVGTWLKTIVRLWAAPSRTQSSRLIVSVWWVLPERLPVTIPADTQPSRDLKHLMHGHPATKLFKTSTQTSTTFSTKPS
jgi:hypothetical protein